MRTSQSMNRGARVRRRRFEMRFYMDFKNEESWDLDLVLGWVLSE